MFVNPEKADEAYSMLNVLAEELTKKPDLSQFDQKILGCIKDIIDTIGPKPFESFDKIDDAARVYVSLRDQLSIERRAWETHEAEVKGYMGVISVWFNDKADELGVDSFKTKYGTPYRNVKTSYRSENWVDFLNWMKETGNFQCVEKRPAKLACAEIHEQTGDVPPGLTYHTEIEFLVRRA